MTDVCETCRFFRWKRAETKQFEDVAGCCHRYAPQGFTPVASGTFFPPMQPWMWCGEHQHSPVLADSVASNSASEAA